MTQDESPVALEKKVATSCLSSLLQRQYTMNFVSPSMQMGIAIITRCLGPAGIRGGHGGALLQKHRNDTLLLVPMQIVQYDVSRFAQFSLGLASVSAAET